VKLPARRTGGVAVSVDAESVDELALSIVYLTPNVFTETMTWVVSIRGASGTDSIQRFDKVASFRYPPLTSITLRKQLAARASCPRKRLFDVHLCLV
jgi:hypothetical protein